MLERKQGPPKQFWKPNGAWLIGVFAMPCLSYISFGKGDWGTGLLCAALSPVCLWILVKNVCWLIAFNRDGDRHRPW